MDFTPFPFLFSVSAAGGGSGTRAAGGRSSKVMKGQDFIIEDKLDGERMVVHKRGSDIMVFSRKINRCECTRVYPADICPLLTFERPRSFPEYAEVMAKWFKAHILAENCILDGEMMAWDDEEERFCDFGANRVGHWCALGSQSVILFDFFLQTIVNDQLMDPDSKRHMVCFPNLRPSCKPVIRLLLYAVLRRV